MNTIGSESLDSTLLQCLQSLITLGGLSCAGGLPGRHPSTKYLHMYVWKYTVGKWEFLIENIFLTSAVRGGITVCEVNISVYLKDNCQISTHSLGKLSFE